MGIVADVPQYWFDWEPRPTLYVPYLQAPRPSLNVVLRTRGEPRALAEPARRRIMAVDRTQPVEEVRTLRQVVVDATAFLRVAAGLVAALAAVAALLGAAGVYGLLAHYVEQSTRQLGLRMALGARPADVLRLVLGDALKLAAAGTALGLPAALALGCLLSSLLSGVASFDPASLAAVALLAAYLPASRAAGLDPAEALRGG